MILKIIYTLRQGVSKWHFRPPANFINVNIRIGIVIIYFVFVIIKSYTHHGYVWLELVSNTIITYRYLKYTFQKLQKVCSIIVGQKYLGKCKI